MGIFENLAKAIKEPPKHVSARTVAPKLTIQIHLVGTRAEASLLNPRRKHVLSATEDNWWEAVQALLAEASKS